MTLFFQFYLFFLLFFALQMNFVHFLFAHFIVHQVKVRFGFVLIIPTVQVWIQL